MAKKTKDAKTESKLTKDQADAQKLVELDADPSIEDDEAPTPKSVVPEKYKRQYGKTGNNGDDLAVFLKELDFEADVLPSAKKDAGIDVLDRWGHLNPGMQRMNLGNVLRGAIKKGNDVTICGRTFADAPV